MPTNTETIKAEAQKALDELFANDLIPFKLTAQVVESIGMEEYIIRFYDSRLYSIDFSWRPGQALRSIFKAAVLERIGRLRSCPRVLRTAS